MTGSTPLNHRLRSGLAALFGKVDRRGLHGQLTARPVPHDPGQITNTQHAVAQYGMTTFAAVVHRYRRQLRSLVQAVLDERKRLTVALVNLRAFDAQEHVQANKQQRSDAAGRHASGHIRLSDSRISPLLFRLGAPALLLVDYGFIAGILRDLYSISFVRFDVGEVPLILTAFVVPIVLGFGTLGIVESAGKLTATAAAMDREPNRAEQLMGRSILTNGEKRRLLLLRVAIAVNSVFFFVLGISRVTGEATTAGVDVPPLLLACFFGVLPVLAYVLATLGADPFHDHDRRVLREGRGHEARRRLLEREVLDATERLRTAWNGLRQLIAEIIATSQVSVQLVEQIIAFAYAETGEVGPLAPIVTGHTVPQQLEGPHIPRVEPLRSLAMPLPAWITTELLPALDVLITFAPTDWSSSANVAQQLLKPTAARSPEDATAATVSTGSSAPSDSPVVPAPSDSPEAPNEDAPQHGVDAASTSDDAGDPAAEGSGTYGVVTSIGDARDRAGEPTP